jgi:hypothetical protein
MALDRTQAFSPLARQFQSLVDSGLISLNPVSVGDFPCAYVVLPVYDSDNASRPPQPESLSNHAKLARHP